MMPRKSVIWTGALIIMFILNIIITGMFFMKYRTVDQDKSYSYLIRGIIVAIIIGYKLTGRIKEVKMTKLSNKEIAAMHESQFWEIINKANQTSQGQEERLSSIADQIREHSIDTAISFQKRLDILLYQLYRQDIQCAGHIIIGGYSEERYRNFCLWIIGQGEEFYKKTMENADTLSEFRENSNVDSVSFEELGNLIYKIIQSKANKSLYELEQYNYDNSNKPQIENAQRSENDMDSLRTICPKLCEIFYDRPLIVEPDDMEYVFESYIDRYDGYLLHNKINPLTYEISLRNGKLIDTIDLNTVYKKEWQKHEFDKTMAGIIKEIIHKTNQE